jgi:hypothetical protein
MLSRRIHVLKVSMQEAIGEISHQIEWKVLHKTMVGLTLVDTETVDAVSDQGAIDHTLQIEANGVLMSDPVVPAHLVWKERSVVPTVNAVVGKSVAANETAAVDETGSVKVNDQDGSLESRAKAVGASAALGMKGDLRVVRTAEAEAEEPQTMVESGHVNFKTKAKDMET